MRRWQVGMGQDVNDGMKIWVMSGGIGGGSGGKYRAKPRFTNIYSWGCLFIHQLFFISIHSPPIHQLRFQVLRLWAYIQGKT